MDNGLQPHRQSTHIDAEAGFHHHVKEVHELLGIEAITKAGGTHPLLQLGRLSLHNLHQLISSLVDCQLFDLCHAAINLRVVQEESCMEQLGSKELTGKPDRAPHN